MQRLSKPAGTASPVRWGASSGARGGGGNRRISLPRRSSPARDSIVFMPCARTCAGSARRGSGGGDMRWGRASARPKLPPAGVGAAWPRPPPLRGSGRSAAHPAGRSPAARPTMREMAAGTGCGRDSAVHQRSYRPLCTSAAIGERLLAAQVCARRRRPTATLLASHSVHAFQIAPTCRRRRRRRRRHRRPHYEQRSGTTRLFERQRRGAKRVTRHSSTESWS